VDELDLFRDLGGGPVAPSNDVRRRASAQLAKVIEREQVRSSGPLRRGTRRQYSVLAFAATLVVGGATALFLSAPWASSPGFLERALAALTPPTGTVLHYKWEETWTSTQFSCTVTQRPSEIWIDQTWPRKFRAVLGHYPPAPSNPSSDPQILVAPSSDPRKEICSRGTSAEIGGDLTESPTLMFFPPDWLSYAPLQYHTPYDPVGDLRQAIRAGRAHHDGTMQLAGRTVERIRIDPPSRCPLPSGCEPGYAYVDPENFHLVQTEGLGAFFTPGQAIAQFKIAQFKVVRRYMTFEFLPRTPASAALADIVAQHPNAGGPYSKKRGRG
jgi:hypothetical protein